MRKAIALMLLLTGCSGEPGSNPASPQSRALDHCARYTTSAPTWARSERDRCLAAEANRYHPVDASICKAAHGELRGGKCALLIF
jgi:hypothetical protein